jgi:hypothetical protein
MKWLNRALLVALCVLPMLFATAGWAQTKTSSQNPSASAGADTQEKNVQAYIELMRADVRQQKAEIMGAVMLLSADDATKFWPIYNDYDAALSRLSDQRVANIQEYARTYDQMTDEKADELIRNAMAYRKQRSELLEKTYGRMKQALGAITAARFVQVENQLLEIIDLQIAANLPIAGSGS